MVINIHLAFRLNNQPNKQGQFLIMLRITRTGETPRYLGTEICVDKKYFNENGTLEKRNWIRSNHPFSVRLNTTLFALHEQALATIDFLKQSQAGLLTAANVRDYIKKGDQANFIKFCTETALRLRKEDAVANASGYEVLYTHLIRFLGSEELPVGHINVAFLRSFVEHLRTCGHRRYKDRKGGVLAESTISGYMGKFRTAYNAYHTEHLIKPQNNPFDFFEIAAIPNKEDRGELTVDQINQLIDFDPVANNLKTGETNALYVYLLLYGLQGMRLGDLVRLKKDQFQYVVSLNSLDGKPERNLRLYYRMNKIRKHVNAANKEQSLIVPEFLVPIVEHYRNQPENEHGLFLPLMINQKPKKGYKFDINSPEDVHKRVNAASVYVNQNLKKLLKRLGIETKVTMHAARHAYASHLYEETEDIRLTQIALNHTQLATTTRYLGTSRERVNSKTLGLFKKVRSVASAADQESLSKNSSSETA